MHKRRKRKLSNKHKTSIICGGFEISLFQTRKNGSKVRSVFFKGREVPEEAFKGFTLSVQNPLADVSEKQGFYRTYLDLEPEINFSVEVTDEFFRLLGMRKFTEKNDDGTFTHTMICDTKDYEVFNDGVIE
jgi:hypothetical protein